MFKSPQVLRTSAMFNICLSVFMGLTAESAWGQNCNRECMTGLLTDYIDAVVAHDPSNLPLLENYRYTENSRPVMLGEGLWQSVTGKTAFRHDYLDTTK